MNDMASAIVPKSDQLNSDDLIAGPLTIKVTAVTIRGGQEQPVAISYEGDGGKPYKSCKSMNRVLVTAWGPDATKYVGRSMTLYRDPAVKWGGMEVGGIRISHLSHLEAPITMALTATKGSRKPFTVKPLKASGAAAGGSQPDDSALSTRSSRSSEQEEVNTGQSPATRVAPEPTISPEEVSDLENLCKGAKIPVELLLGAAKVERLADIKSDRLAGAHKWIDKKAEERR